MHESFHFSILLILSFMAVTSFTGSYAYGETSNPSDSAVMNSNPTNTLHVANPLILNSDKLVIHNNTLYLKPFVSIKAFSTNPATVNPDVQMIDPNVATIKSSLSDKFQGLAVNKKIYSANGLSHQIEIDPGSPYSITLVNHNSTDLNGATYTIQFSVKGLEPLHYFLIKAFLNKTENLSFIDLFPLVDLIQD